MPTINDPLAPILAADTRYARQAYHFLDEAVRYTVHMLGLDRPDVEDRHVSGQQLLEGIRRLGLERFGYLARTVFESWGVMRTEDWGEIVFNLVEGRLMNKTERDSREDFAHGYDFAAVFEEAYFRDGLYRDDEEVYVATSTISPASLDELRTRLEEASAGDVTEDEGEVGEERDMEDHDYGNGNGNNNNGAPNE